MFRPGICRQLLRSCVQALEVTNPATSRCVDRCSRIPTQQIRTLSRNSSSKREVSDNPKQNQSSDNEKNGSESDEESSLKLLMDFVPRGMPNFLYSIKNFYIVKFVIGTQVDKTFNFTNFVNGAKHALVTVSGHLAHNQLENLEGLVEKNALEEIRRNYEKLSVSERNELQIQPNDIVLSFAHNVNVETMHEGFTGTNKHIVKIFMVFDCVRNLEDVLRDKASKRANPGEVFSELQKRKFVCNYEFTREYIEGVATGEWTISKLLHIRETDLLNLIMRR